MAIHNSPGNCTDGSSPGAAISDPWKSVPSHCTTRWRNGQTRSEGSYQADLPHGPWRFFYPNGETFSEATFDAGVYEGDYHEYYDDGSPKAEGAYIDGAKTGTWTYWDEDGNARSCQGDERC